MKYYYNDGWYTYEELYQQFGITLEPPNLVTLYDTDLTQFDGWEYNESTWIISDNRWYSCSDLPYYKKTDIQTSVYFIDQPLSLDVYSRRESNLLLYESHLSSFEYLHNTKGITWTSSTVYYVKNGIIRCWYNHDIDQYWDTDTSAWYDEAPDYRDDPFDVDSIDKVGAVALFLFMRNAENVQYGALTNGVYLKPVSVNLPTSGELHYTTSTPNNAVTGTWRILTPVKRSSVSDPCVILATKVSNDNYNGSLYSAATNNTSGTSNFVEIIQYDL